MSKLFVRIIFCSIVLICYLLCDFRTFTLLICVVIVLLQVFVVWYESQCVPIKRRPGTITRNQWYISKKKSFKFKSSSLTLTFSKRPKLIGSINEATSKSYSFYSALDTALDNNAYSIFSSRFLVSQHCQTDMSFLKSSNSSINVFESSPIRRPLRIRNSVDGVNSSPIRRDSVSSFGDNSLNESRLPGDNMSVGEFPLISLVSSLHEAVSPKPARLKPSPVRIRIQPVQPPELLNEPVVDPVVTVLKQIASNKRILAPSILVSEEEQKEKKSRLMPRHDLTHSLLESQLTINSNREGGSSSKREREEVQCATSSACGSSASAPKRMCARTLRSNEILSSLSSSVSLVSPPPSNKTYAGKRKSVALDKYKKMRKMEESANQTKSASASPVKVDKGVNVQAPPENPSLPVITIKRDEVSERVVSRAMVSALLKSTVAKLIMSGDPAVYPLPNGTQSRQPEVNPPEFGPPKGPSPVTALSTVTSGISVHSSSNLTFNLPQSDKSLVSGVSVSQPSSGFNFSSQQTSSATSITSQTATTTVQSPSTSSGTVQPLFSLNKPQVSTSAVPSFGLGATSTTSATAASPSPQFGIPSTSSGISTAPPSFSTPSTSVATSLPLPIFGSSLATTKAPTFGLPSTTSSLTPAAPTFGLSSSGAVVTTSSFTFGSSSSIEVKTSSANAPPSFASVVAGSAATPSFGLSTTSTNSSIPSTTATVVSTGLFGTSLTPTTLSSAPLIKFGVISSTTTTSSISTPLFGIPVTTSAASTPAYGTVTTSSSSNHLISPHLTVSSVNTPVFGSTTAINSTPVFGSSLSTIKPLETSSAPTTTSSSNIFTSSSTPVFGGTAATSTLPVFGASTLTTTSQNIFGATPVATSSTQSMFQIVGNPLPTSIPAFGSTKETLPVTATFGTTATTTSNSIFGSFTNTVTTSATPIFGATTTTSTSATPLFGTVVSTTSGTPLFGTSSATTAPLFGASSSTASVFGGSTTATTAAPIFGTTTSLAPSTTLFGGNTTTTTQAPLFGSGSTSFAPSGFGGSSTVKPSEGLFGMPSSNSGFKASSPFQVGGSGDVASSTPAFGSSGANTQPKPFEFGSSKPSTGGFTFKPSGTATPFSAQTQSQTTTPAFSQPQAQAPFNFTGSNSTPAVSSGSSLFVFGTPQTQSAAPAAGAKPFQFGTSAAPNSASAFGQSFTPTFGQSPAASNLSFGNPQAPATPGFQFSATQPATPGGAAGGLFSIGTGSTSTRAKHRRDGRRR